MYGGIAVARNLLCLTYTAGSGRVFLIDLEECKPMDLWKISGEDRTYSDAGGVAIDASFTIYVADTHGDLVRRFTAFGKELEPLGKPDLRPPGAASRDRRGSLSRPNAVAAHLGNILVACGDQPLRRGVQRFGADGFAETPLSAFGDPEREFGAPRGVSAGPDGVFIADTLNGVVQRFTSDYRFVNAIPTARQMDSVGRPIAVQVLPDQTVLVVDQGDQPGLRRYDFNGHLVESVAPNDALEDPVGLALDDEDRIYVLDRDGERVLRLRSNLTVDMQVLDLKEYLYDS